MKKLKQTTIQRYSNKKILKHLDKFMSAHFNFEPFRIDFQYSEVRVRDTEDNAYLFFCSFNDRNAILNALFVAYKLTELH